VPIPASVALSAAAGFASQGYLNIYAVLIVTFVGSIIGDLFGYVLAREYGEKFLDQFIFFRRLMKSNSYRRVEDYIVDFAPSLIFFSRFLTELSPAANILSGLSKVSYKTFLIFAAFGEIVYTLLFGLTGFFLGREWEDNISFLLKAGLVLLSLGIAVNLIQVLLYRRRRKK
jgi:membrane protein DedA with SNARE-associated domain